MSVTRLRVMAEYGSSGIWGIPRERKGAFRHGMIELSALALPPAIVTRFTAWSESYFARLEGPFDVYAFNDEGWELSCILQVHVGESARVVHAAELPNGGLCADREVVFAPDLPEAWSIVDRAKSGLGAELVREVGPGHGLFGYRAWPFAKRGDCDDVLFAVEHPQTPWAIVHLTWKRMVEQPPWPSTERFATWEEALVVFREE